MSGLPTIGQLREGMCARCASIAAPARSGFTIAEVLIVLVITSALFVSAVVLISGRQRQTEFDQAIQQVRAQIQQIMNQVASGYFPGASNFQCTADALHGPQLSTAGTNGQGTNNGCIFVGKVVQFKVNSTTPERFATYTIAGLQQNAAGEEAASLSDTKPRLVAPGTSDPPSFPNLTELTPLQGGLTTLMNGANNGMYYDAGTITQVGAIAFVNSFGQTDSAGQLISGGSQISVVPVNGTNLNMTQPQAVDAIDANLATSPLNPAKGVSICFVSAGTSQSGLITIGAGGSAASVTLAIKGNTTCA